MPEYTTKPNGAISVPVGSNIQSMVNAASTGATFWIEAGIHRLQQIDPKDGQNFIGADGAVLNGAKLLTSFTQQNGLWVASGQTQQGQRNADGHSEPGMPRASYPDAFFINDKPMQHVDALSKVGPGKYFFDYIADKIYFGDNPAGKKVEAAISPFAFGGDSADVTISNLIVEKYAAPIQNAAIFGQGENWTVQDNEVRLNYGVGIDVADNGKILNNFVHDNGEMGLAGGGGNILVRGNEIASNGYWSGYDMLWEGGGAKFTGTDGLIVRGNFSHGNKGFGLWTDIDNINSLYEDNRVDNNTLGGIFHEISYKATIRNNTFYGNGQPDGAFLLGSAIRIANSQNVDVYGNTIDMTTGGNGIALIQENRGTGAFGTYVTQNNTIHHNVVISGDSGGAVGGFAGYNEVQMLAANKFDYNEYRVTSASDDHWAWGDYYDWNTYRQASKQDAHGTLTIINPYSAIPPTPPEPTMPPVTPVPPATFPYTSGTWTETPASTKTINGTSNNNTLTGTTVSERFDGKSGSDIMFGKGGGDTYIVDSSGDRVIESTGQGIDLVLLRTTAFTMPDNVENLNIDYSGRATVHGNNQANIIVGGAGNDTIIGDNGADRMTGGAGNDTFIFHKTEVEGDMIVDFKGNGTSAGDVLQFQGFGTGALLEHTGDIWKIVYTEGSETFKLVGVTSLAAGDYVFM